MEKSILISYDLIKPGQDYSRLFEAIKTLGSWCHFMESTWIIKSSMTTVQIRDYLKSFIDGNDKIFIGELTGVAAWNNLSVECSNWLKEKL